MDAQRRENKKLKEEVRRMRDKENFLLQQHQNTVDGLNQQIILGTQQAAHVASKANELQQVNTGLQQAQSEAERRLAEVANQAKVVSEQWQQSQAECQRIATEKQNLQANTQAQQVQWTQPIQRYHAAVSHIRSLGLGLIPSITLYNTLAFPKISWKASFFEPTTATLQHEHKAIQHLTNSPWNAIPNDLIHTLRDIGLPAQAHSLSTTSTAARTRNALETMTTYHDNINMIQETLSDDNRTLRPLLHEVIS